MNNEEAKNLMIRTHWEEAGFDWSWIKRYVTDSGTIAVADPNDFQASKEYRFAFEESLIRALGPWQNKYHYELYSLTGVEKNNGWTRIEPDRSNLPDKSGLVDIIEYGKERRVYYNATTQEFTDNVCFYSPSHFDIVKPRELPRW